jgi:charged multivesicular body protein 4
MHRLFGRPQSSASSNSNDDAAILKELHESRELLEKREEHLQRKVDQEVASAVEHKKAGRKNAALACLKRKQMTDKELASLLEQRTKLDAQEHTLLSLKFAGTTMATERRAADAIAAKIKSMGGPDAFEDQREKTEETLEDAYEMLNAASQPFSNPALGGVTDEELLAQLEELEEEEDRKRFETDLTRIDGIDVGPSELRLPGVPTTQAKRDEEELAELEKLAASMEVAVPMPMLGMAAPALIAMAA